LPAVEHRVCVALGPAAAFDLFTRQIARWWPLQGHSCFGGEAADVQFEPRVGGAVTEVARDGDRMAWGTITDWSPPEAFAMSWHPGLDESQATVLRVRFAAVGDGTEVSVRHGGWEARSEHAADKRDQYDRGWPTTLAAFEACAGRVLKGAA
jgi:uncharacterized protein YndB with AHSA1/START domain